MIGIQSTNFWYHVCLCVCSWDWNCVCFFCVQVEHIYHTHHSKNGFGVTFLLFRYNIFTDDILSTFTHHFERSFRYFNSRFVVVDFILDVYFVYHSNDLFTFSQNLRGFYVFRSLSIARLTFFLDFLFFLLMAIWCFSQYNMRFAVAVEVWIYITYIQCILFLTFVVV